MNNKTIIMPRCGYKGCTTPVGEIGARCPKHLGAQIIEDAEIMKDVSLQLKRDAQHANLLRELVRTMQAEQRARREFMQGVFGKSDLTVEQRHRVNVLIEALSITADAKEVGGGELSTIFEYLD